MSEDFVQQAWTTAEYHLGQASIQPEAAAGATVHSAYYAMFHAARAVLLRASGSAPKKHSGVITQFGSLVRHRSQALKQAGHDLNRLEDSRIIADYHPVRRMGAEDARDALIKARQFLDLCAMEFGFPREGSPDG